MTPTIGRIVHYTLTAGDVGQINQRREAARAALTTAQHPSPLMGNYVEAGQVYSAQIVRIFGTDKAVNLKVSLDGYDEHWATSRTEGDGEGHWAWPPRV